jgi:hypothetical protein
VKADQFIVGRVSSETKARLRALAERELLSESALLRRLVELVLLKAGLAPIITETPTGARARRGARLMIRLRPDDQILLRERAAARGMPAATYVSVLTRAHLQSLTPQYVAKWRDAIRASGLSSTLRNSVLSHIDYNSFYGLGVIVITVPPQTELSYVGDELFWRKGDTTELAVGAKDIAALAKRF